MFVEMALKKYKDEIPDTLTSLAESKRLKLNIKDVEIMEVSMDEKSYYRSESYNFCFIERKIWVVSNGL